MIKLKDVELDYFSKVIDKLNGLTLPLDHKTEVIIQNAINSAVRLDVPVNECVARIKHELKML